MHACSVGRLIQVTFWLPARGGGLQLRLAMACPAQVPGTFVLGTGDVPGTRSVHFLQWQVGQAAIVIRHRGQTDSQNVNYLNEPADRTCMHRVK